MPHGSVPIKVFLVDDSELICDRVQELLRGAGMEVVGRAASPQSSQEAILQSRPDVVVLDVQLEGGNGMEVLRHIRLIAPRVAFVIFSNNSGPAYRKRYMAGGASGFVDKSEFHLLAQAVKYASSQPVS